MKSKEEMRIMKIRTQLKAGKRMNHNETMRVRTAVAAGKIATNHNEPLQVRTGLKGGKLRKQIVTTSPKEDRLTLLVVRAGLRAGRLRGRR
jgi:hypothetical protein